MHAGKPNSNCQDIIIISWILEQVEETNTIFQVKNILEDDNVMEESTKEKYLGDIIMSNGSNATNIQARTSKAIRITDQIVSILEGVCFGPFYFEVAALLRNRLLVIGILTNSEVWYELSPKKF